MKWIRLRRSKIKVYGKKSQLLMKGMTAPEEHTHFLQGLLTNDVRGLNPGEFNYNLWLKHNGAPIGDFFVYRFPDYFLLDTEEPAQVVIEEFNKLKLSLRVFFEEMDFQHLLVFGEGAKEFIENELGMPAPEEYRFVLKGDVVIANNPVRLKVEAFDIFGKSEGLQPPSEGEISREELEDIRIQKCVPRIHKELKEGFSPLEAGVLDYAISLTKGCYVGQEAIARVHFRGRTPRLLAKLEPLEGSIAEGDKLIEEGKSVGVITSLSPTGRVALGYLLRSKAQEGKEFLTEKGGRVLLKSFCSA